MLFHNDIIPPNLPEYYYNSRNNSEIEWDWLDGRSYFYNNHYLYTFMTIMYIPFIFSLKFYMKNKKAFNLKVPLVFWNFIAALFSTVAFFYTVPVLIENINNNFHDSVCDYKCYFKKESFWIFLFNASKVFEWIDTLFILLRKRKLIFLHWFHHIITMLYCWQANQVSCITDCSGWWFATINLFVHSIMYTYYGFSSLKIRIPFSNIITLLQTIQMFIGTYIVLYSIFKCKYTWEYNQFGSIFGLSMYFVYVYLFSKLLINRLKRKKD